MENILGRPFKEEFLLSKFGLSYPDPDAFVRSQWPGPRFLYLLWRLFWLLWHVGWIIASGVNTRVNHARYPEEGAKWFIYLTNTTLLLTSLTSLVDFVIVFYVTVWRGGTVLDMSDGSQKKESKQPSSSPKDNEKEEIVFQGLFTVVEGLEEYTTPWYLKLQWFLYNVVSSTNIIITILYWAVEFTGATDAVGVVVHSINSVFIILNIFVAAMPVQILHLIYPMAYAALYMLFNFLYIILGGTDLRGRDVIYTVIDWSKPHPTAVVVVLGVLVAAPLGHLLVFAVFTLRLYIHSKVKPEFCSTHKGRINAINRTSDVAETSTAVEIEACTPL